MVVVREYSVFLTELNMGPPYFKLEYKLTLDFATQCSLFTYTVDINIMVSVVLCVSVKNNTSALLLVLCKNQIFYYIV